MLWGNTAGSKRTIADLCRATRGSAGLDLCATSYTVLTPEMGVQTLATGVFGPLPPGTAGLLLGRSSASLKGILIHPGVIDSDYTGEIKILASAPNKIIVINAGQRIAQLLLVPLVI